MILLFNVKITNSRFIHYSREVHYPNDDRYDIFKYCLASYAVCEPILSKCVFFIELADEYQDKKDDLEKYIYQLYPSDKIILNWYRNNYTRDWRETYSKIIDKINDEIIWLAVNDDHVFLDSSIDRLKIGEKILNEDDNKMSILIFSHWFEFIRIADSMGGVPIENNEYIKFRHNIFCGVHICTKDRFYKYWHEYDYGDNMVFRTDNLSHLNTGTYDGNMYVPTKEMCRHYDGYSHVGHFPNLFPPLCIPYGFFENNIKIRYGYDERKDGYTTLNPSAELLYGKDRNGIDYRCLLNEIPLFWKDKIVEIDINPEYNLEENKGKRNDYFLQSARSIPNSYNFIFKNPPPIDWFKNHLL